MAKRKATSSDFKRWLGWLALVIVFSIACAFLSQWQFGRRGEALTAMNQLNVNYDSPAVELQSIEKPWGFHTSNSWRQVTVTGHYLPANAMLVRNRPLDGNAGFLELVPFQLTDGTVVAIERGWVAADDNYAAPKTFALPSDQSQTVTAHLRAAEPAVSDSAPSGQLPSINIAQFAKATGIKDRFYAFSYLRMATESVPAVSSLKLLPRPTLDEGNHLSYALQWILFAVMAVTALFWAIRKERQALAGVVKIKRKDADSAFEDGALGG
ncbi:MAG: SURF1 family protein [Micrococcales bacterium]